jgi:hypothetical protein
LTDGVFEGISDQVLNRGRSILFSRNQDLLDPVLFLVGIGVVGERRDVVNLEIFGHGDFGKTRAGKRVV